MKPWNICQIFYAWSTSSSGQDVALWPRQPRVKSWCGHMPRARWPKCWGTCLVTATVAVGKVNATTNPGTCFHHNYSSGRPRWATLSCTLRPESGNLKKQPSLTGRSLFEVLKPFQIFFGAWPTSSGGQDVALWPRQPRFKSWCGQTVPGRDWVLGLSVSALGLASKGSSLMTGRQRC